MNTMVIGISIAVMIVLYTLWATLGYPKIKMANFSEQKNIKKEKKLLAVLLKDIKNNPGHWVRGGFAPFSSSGLTNTFLNDKKNMAIRYNTNEATAQIHFNLKNVTTFVPEDSDAILTSVHGKHVGKFIKIVIRILDHRGKELEYFTERLKDRL